MSSTTVSRLLHELGYSLQSVRKSLERTSPPDRDAQFEHINTKADDFLQRCQPVVSVDTKKKELVGEFKNGGRVELIRIRGHLTLWGGGIHHAEIKTAVRAGVPAPDG